MLEYEGTEEEYDRLYEGIDRRPDMYPSPPTLSNAHVCCPSGSGTSGSAGEDARNASGASGASGARKRLAPSHKIPRSFSALSTEQKIARLSAEFYFLYPPSLSISFTPDILAILR